MAGISAAAPLPDLTVIPNSFGVQLKENNMSPENLDQIRDLGAKWVRRGFIWTNVEKTAGEYDFSRYDELVKNAHERGMNVLAGLALGNNKLYGSVIEDKGREAYARYAAAAAAHFKGQNVLFEIWNEPNVRTFWGSQDTNKDHKHNSEPFAEDYTKLVQATVKEMKQADPNCIVFGGSVSGLWSASFSWMDMCFEKGILKSGIDAWSVHPYSTKNPEDYVEAYATMRASMARHGARPDYPVFNTERGFPLGKAEGYAGGDASKAKEYQAWHIVRQYLVDRACDIKFTVWYEWSGKEGFSLIDGNEKLPAYNAAKFMIKQLSGYKFDKRIVLENDRDFALRFSSTDGDVKIFKIVAWTSPPAGESPDKIVDHDVVLTVDAKGPIDVFQLYGEKGTIETKNGNVSLKLTGAPQSLSVKSGR